MNDRIVKFNLTQRNNKNIPKLQSGDIVKIYRKIKEGKKERTQIFEGIIIAINAKQSSSPTITVRKVSNGVGVELVLPVFSPNIEKIEVIKKAQVRRSKLYYIRNKSAKSLRLKYKDMVDFAVAEESTDPKEGIIDENARKDDESREAKNSEKSSPVENIDEVEEKNPDSSVDDKK